MRGPFYGSSEHHSTQIPEEPYCSINNPSEFSRENKIMNS